VGDFHIQRAEVAEVAAADGISYRVFPTLLMSVTMPDTWLLEGGVTFPQLQGEMNAVNIQLLVSPEHKPSHCTSALQQ